MRRRSALLLALLGLGAACSGGTAQRPDPVVAARPADAAPPAEHAPTAAAPTDAEIARVADDLLARAKAHEPDVSAILQGVATKVGGTLGGFEHRLKTRDSLLRKLRTVLAKAPEGGLAQVVIDDALRYTLVVDDVPAGTHAAAIRATFAELEKAGHKVVKAKNYWPRGDNYSGVNSVLETPDGLPWELQFHTSESFRIQHRDHELYEEMRLDTTPVERKRELYEQLAAPWETVPIPKDMLVPGALHAAEEIIQRPPP